MHSRTRGYRYEYFYSSLVRLCEISRKTCPVTGKEVSKRFARCCRQAPGLRSHGDEATAAVFFFFAGGGAAVVWVHSRAEHFSFGLWVEKRVRRGTQQPVRRPCLFYPLTATERRLRESKLAANYVGDTTPHMHDVAPPTAALIIRASELQKGYLCLARASLCSRRMSAR